MAQSQNAANGSIIQVDTPAKIRLGHIGPLQNCICELKITHRGVFRKSSGGQPQESATCYLKGARSEGRHRCPICSRTPSWEIWVRFGRRRLRWMCWGRLEWLIRTPAWMQSDKNTLGRPHESMVSSLLRSSERAVAEDWLFAHSWTEGASSTFDPPRAPTGAVGLLGYQRGHAPMFPPPKHAHVLACSRVKILKMESWNPIW